jgi:hypothetical protein
MKLVGGSTNAALAELLFFFACLLAPGARRRIW